MNNLLEKSYVKALFKKGHSVHEINLITKISVSKIFKYLEIKK